MATHSSILAWRGQRSLAGYSPWGRKESDTVRTERHTHPHTLPPGWGEELTQGVVSSPIGRTAWSVHSSFPRRGKSSSAPCILGVLVSEGFCVWGVAALDSSGAILTLGQKFWPLEKRGETQTVHPFSVCLGREYVSEYSMKTERTHSKL